MAAVDKAMERAQKAQKDAAAGQTGLFGLFNEAPAHGRSADDLPNVPDWEESERLANEKEVLGFFVSGHPLDKYAEKLRNLTGVIDHRRSPRTQTARAHPGASRPDPADEIQVAGMILGLSVQKSKRDPESSTPRPPSKTPPAKSTSSASRATTSACRIPEDRSPRPRPRPLRGEEDAAPKLSVTAIQALEDVKIRLPNNVRIRISLDRVSDTTLVELRDLVVAAPGPARVMLNVEQPGEYCVVMEPEGIKVAADRAFIDKVELLLGARAVQSVD